MYSIFGCNNKISKQDTKFNLISKNSYLIDYYNGLSIYRLKETKKPMDGYYVIGDKFKKWEEFNVNQGILNGKLHGEEKIYYMSGSLKRLNNYSNGIRYGKTTEYFETGQILSESKVENNEVIESIAFNNIGQITSQMFIKEGREIRQNIKNGKVVYEQISSNYDNFEAMRFYNEDGGLAIYLRMLEEENKSYLIELDENENEIKRIDVKSNPQELLKYQKYLSAI